MDRRRFLQLSAAALAATPLAKGCDPGEAQEGPHVPPAVDRDGIDGGQPVAFAPENIAIDAAVFHLGVQAGSMDQEGGRFWTHLAAAAPAPLHLLVWRESKTEGEVILVHDLAVTPDDDGYVNLVVQGLAPSTVYFYGFFVAAAGGGALSFAARSTIGRTKTAWADGWLVPVVLGATTCTAPQNAPFTALSRLAEQEIDAFVHLGDMVYADGSRTRADYRRHWHRAIGDPGYQDLLPRQGGYYVWDDHEFDNNLNPETADPDMVQAAKDEFFATLPMGKNSEDGLWQSFVWGDTLELILLDCRTERLPSTRTADNATYISDAQMAWAKDRLKNSPCHFKVLLNSVPMTRMPELWILEGDRWQGYEAQRTELLTFLEAEGVQNVWFLSGDFHIGFVARVEPAGYGRNVFECAVGPGGNLGNPLGFLARQDGYREQVFPSSQFFYGDGVLAATTLAFDPIHDRVRVRYIGLDGEVLFDHTITRRS
jgi:alkaline phosphatase D